MTLGEVMLIFDTLGVDDGDQRRRILNGLVLNLSPVSRQSLRDFQEKWKSNDGNFKDFIVEQNKVIRMCVEMERDSKLGEIIRKEFKLEPLTDETVIL